MSRWSTLLMDSSELTTLPKIPLDQVSTHAEQIFRKRLGPEALYRRWDRQQWSVDDIDLAADREAYEKLPALVRRKIEEIVNTFIVGEYTGLDLLGPILQGCPDESSLVYLGTQVADESRHTVLLASVAVDMLGMEPDLTSMLPTLWAKMTDPHRELSVVEADLVRELAEKPSDYSRWLRAVTHFHLITEGVLALNGQRGLVQGLRRFDALPNLQAGFIAMARDESRHVSYGMHALRQGLLEGHHDDIMDVLEECAPLAVHIEQREATPTAHSRRTARELTRELERRLRQLDLPEKSVQHILTVAGRPFEPGSN